MNVYDLIRNWYNFKFDNPSKTKAIHSDLFCYLVDKWNRLGQKNEFGLPTEMTMELLNIGSYNTYKKTLNELVDFGFVKIVKESKNQHTSKIVALSKIDKATDKALDKATIKASDKPTDKPIDTINRQINKEQLNNKTNNNKTKKGAPPSYDEFINHAKEKAKERNIDLDENKVRTKFDAWLENDWCDLNGKKILNWKVKITSNINYWQGNKKDDNAHARNIAF